MESPSQLRPTISKPAVLDEMVLLQNPSCSTSLGFVFFSFFVVVVLIWFELAG